MVRSFWEQFRTVNLILSTYFYFSLMETDYVTQSLEAPIPQPLLNQLMRELRYQIRKIRLTGLVEIILLQLLQATPSNLLQNLPVNSKKYVTGASEQYFYEKSEVLQKPPSLHQMLLPHTADVIPCSVKFEHFLYPQMLAYILNLFCQEVREV